jgi:hypothetical protein
MKGIKGITAEKRLAFSFIPFISSIPVKDLFLPEKMEQMYAAILLPLCFAILNYSYLRLSIGSNFAALFAG